MTRAPGYLALEDGRVFDGVGFGADGVRTGEVVFNTSMTGYQEILTDPSYRGQIVTMTYPLIGNYGVNAADPESARPRVEGFVVREYCDHPSNFASERPLGDYLRENDVVALTEIDTRAVTRHTRLAGAMRGVIASGDHDPDDLVDMARESPGLVGRDLVSTVTCDAPYEWTEPCPWISVAPRERRFRVAAMDFGVKYNILRSLTSYGCDVTVVPASTTADEIRAMNPDGLFLSNGPGDPEPVTYAVETIRSLVGELPVFGICLGHQLIGLALGGRTYKLKFGHRGANQPTQDVATGAVAITSQNHGFCVDLDSLPEGSVEVTHMNLNDDTVEGLRHREHPLFCVQYHPEAAAGPHDAEYLFGRFIDMLEAHAG